jgi:hypothetical protein
VSRATRIRKTEHQLRLLEEQFTENLIVALKKCASGQWGMFTPGFFFRSKVKDHPLLGQGDEIMRLRRELGIVEDFPLFQRYLFYRQLRSSNTPGEPKLASQFLRELGLDSK